MKTNNSLKFWVILVVGTKLGHGCFTSDRVRCVFPFIYLGKTYNECTRDSDPDGKRWCATNVDTDGFYIENSKQYGYCSEDCFNKDTDIDTRAADNQISETDKRCGNGETCKNQNSCPSFLEIKGRLKTVQRGGRQYRQLLERMKRKICNKSKQGVCCPNSKKEERCEGGNPCLKENQCEYAQDLRRKFRNGDNNAKNQLIGLICDRKARTFCCPDVTQTGRQTPNPITTRAVTKSSRWLPGKGECGINPFGHIGKIFGGEVSKPGEFPFTALLGYPHRVVNKWVEEKRKYDSWDETRYKCGGTLINRWYVLTAAHCQGKSKRSQISTVRLGEWEVKTDPDCVSVNRNQEVCLDKVQDFEISSDQVTVHEGYERTISNIENDIALIKLPRAAVLNQGVQIVCLPINTQEAARELGLRNIGSGLIGEKATVVGWGYTDFDPWLGNSQGDFKTANVAKSVQQKLEVPVLSSSECTRKFQNFNPKSSQICAGGESGKDSCKGDSGGPLYYAKTAGGLEPWYLLGTVSFGSRQCGSGKPGIYSRIESFVPWIRRQLK